MDCKTKIVVLKKESMSDDGKEYTLFMTRYFDSWPTAILYVKESTNTLITKCRYVATGSNSVMIEMSNNIRYLISEEEVDNYWDVQDEFATQQEEG